MSVTLQLELLLGSVCLLAVIFYMLKKNLLSVKYSLLWLFFAAALILFAAVPYVVYVLRDILNIEIPVNLVFVLLFCFVLLVLLSVSVAMIAPFTTLSFVSMILNIAASHSAVAEYLPSSAVRLRFSISSVMLRSYHLSFFWL